MRIATRGSDLALAQAHTVLRLAQAASPGDQFELSILKTTGDRRQAASMNRPAPDLPKGLFTKELEVALQAGEADLAVHSLKDLPTGLPTGLRLGAVLPRADARDVLVVREAQPAGGRRGLRGLPPGAVVATSSTRRAAQIRALRPDVKLIEIRGNVPTRLRKLAEGRGLDATILAAAGLARLGIRRDREGRLLAPPALAHPGWGDGLFAVPIPFSEMLPAPGQAAIGIEIRQGDRRMASLCRSLEDADSRLCVDAERAFLAGFGGGCHSPVAALARVEDGKVILRVVVFDGDASWQAVAEEDPARARALGTRLGREARRVLARSR